ncbi:MAG: MATE family efflux transporter [Clostridium sp.]|nr:MATE family efflux transporter [Clostridium sp.]
MDAGKRTEIFENLPVGRAVCRQIIPSVASQMVILAYNLADTYFVGMLNDSCQTAAVTVVYSSFVMLTAVSNLFGVGGASAVARALGEKNAMQAKRSSAISFWGGLVSSCLFVVLFSRFEEPILRLSGATAETIGISMQYADWVIKAGAPFVVLNLLLANLLRAEGKAVQASIGVSLSGVANIALDVFCILPQFLGLGAAGAGMATAVSNLIAVIYFIGCVVADRKCTVISFSWVCLKEGWKDIGAVLSVGCPSALQYALTVAAIAAQSAFVSKYATQAVAALGIVKKLDMLPLYFSIGVANGLLPLLAYNYSAGNQSRRKRIFAAGCGISFGFAMLCFVCYECFAGQLAAMFIDDPATVCYSAGFLRRMVVAMPLMSVCYPLIIHFQAMKKIKQSMVVSVLRKGVLDIPLLFLMDWLNPLYGCMWVQPVVDGISLVVAVLMYVRLKEEGLKNFS